MLFKVPNSIKLFIEIYAGKLGNEKSRLIPLYMAGILFSPGKRTMTSLGSSILSDQRHKTAVCKFFRRKTFCSRDILLRILKRLISEELKTYGPAGEWVLIIDGTCTRRGSFTKIANAVQYKTKDSSNKGVSTKAHTFVMGILVSPRGIRYPLRSSYYTKEYCKENRVALKTQNEIAAELYREFRKFLPYRVNMVVLADSFFDSKTMFQAIDRSNTVYLTPADRDRNCNLRYGTEKLHERGKKRKNLTTLTVQEGLEPRTSGQRRFARTDRVGKSENVYRITGETLEIPGAGLCRVVYSWKKKPRTREYSYRVLLCSDPSWSNEKIAEFYALRWQVEMFFRELKSELGIGDFSGQDFEAFERFVDVCLLAFMFLEWHRVELAAKTRSLKEKGRLKVIRTRGMIAKIREDENKLLLMEAKRLNLVA